ncbi:FMN-binding protein [Kribbella qitaiheensis]|uniref:FMN-binding protein n=1 Tax=Kribbella qitaiheensis TaxID=1544730 RepID=A0A7G6X8U0_9ACTN|nr:FMN-binding protein [Kribbella qitaiheensis]QNE22655.1 FMN-binding protein [Kribbella qitaiheensis]
MSTAPVSRTRRNALVFGGTAAVLGLLFLYPTSTNSGRHSTTSAAAPPGVVATTPGAGQPAGSTVVNGTSVPTRYGPVQVRVTIKAGRIVAATAIDYPTEGGRDREINSYAIPVLQRETLVAQSARIDTVSGATYTSDGYRGSLQAALDAAHLK